MVFYSVKITPNIVPLARNRVSIRITISEGLVAKIASINFTGNKIFSSSNLRGQMYLTTGNLLSWWYKDNQYSSEQLNGDMANISAFYLNQGYLDFRINSVQVQLSPDKQSLFININLDEGFQYRYGTIKLAGNTKEVPQKDLEKLITAKPKQIINQEQLTRDVEAIKNAFSCSWICHRSS